MIEGSQTRGFELQLAGRLTDRWTVTTGYSYLDGEVNRADVIQYAQTNGLFHLETSAKANININELFLEGARQLLDGSKLAGPMVSAYGSQEKSARLQPKRKRKNGGCC